MAALDFVKAVYFHATGVGFATNTVAGNSIVVCICGTAANTPTSSGASFSAAIASYASTETGTIRAYYATGITGGSTNALTIAGGGSFDGVAFEVEGATSFDKTNHAAAGTGTASSGSSGTLSTSPEIGIGFISSNGTQPTAGTSWTRPATGFGVNNFAVTMEYQNVAATTAITATSGNSISGWDALILTFSAGGAPAAQPFVGAIANTGQSFNGSGPTSGGRRFFFMGLGGLWQPSN